MAINLGRSQREVIQAHGEVHHKSIRPSKATPNSIGPGTYNPLKDYKEAREK